MPDQTTNLRLNKPDFNIPLWHDEVNDNWEIIDAAITTYLTITGIVGAWENGTHYDVGDKVVDTDLSTLFECAVDHVSAASPTTFAEDRLARPTYWEAPAIVARGLGAWTPSTPYEPNDFVIGTGNIFSVCISPHTSSASFAADSAYWDYLLDISTLGTLPAITGADAGKYLRANLTATASEWVTTATMTAQMGLGTMSTQNASGVNITGGAIIGLTTLDGADATADATIRTNLGVDGMFQVLSVFTSSGTWTKPSGVKRVKVTVTAGGGGGGGANATAAGQGSAGAGGGGGGTAIKVIEAASLAATVSVTVGAGGTGVSGGNGNTGGTSSFGAHCSASGGVGGALSVANATPSPAGSPANGGVGSSGDLNLRGGSGTCGFKNAATTASGGTGGNSFIGGGADGPVANASSTGNAASANTGGGGAGSINVDTSSNRAGGAGGSGLVFVEEFY